tara:strand:- start:53 stop:211 length:159 start_codon:yes stop_codon:yes gene_type:complete
MELAQRLQLGEAVRSTQAMQEITIVATGVRRAMGELTQVEVVEAVMDLAVLE